MSLGGVYLENDNDLFIGGGGKNVLPLSATSSIPPSTGSAKIPAKFVSIARLPTRPSSSARRKSRDGDHGISHDVTPQNNWRLLQTL
jgi:hypothetical protein